MELQQILQQGHGFAVYPAVKIFDEKTDGEKIKWTHLKNLLFGDFIRVLKDNDTFIEKIVKNETYIKVRSRNCTGYILKSKIRPDRILEVNFIDVGQGDGCHVVTPDDQHYIIDAGGSDNMLRFLKWRFNTKRSQSAPPVFNAVISHPDSDHYLGFGQLFKKQTDSTQQFSFKNIYHSALVQREGANELGATIREDNTNYITELVITDQQMKAHLNNMGEGSLHERTLKKALDQHENVNFSAAVRGDINQPEYLLDTPGLKMEILGPLTEVVQNQRTLRYFKAKTGNTDNVGRTKNGHSVVIKLVMGHVRVLLGGDLNPPAEDFLLQSYSGADIATLREKIQNATNASQKQALQDQMNTAIDSAKKHFQVDFAKCCHHGSSDFTSEFLQAVNPLATVISSGDDEPHCHPRPDTLGTIGKYNRGERSYIFSTELMRSSKEFIKIKDLDPKKEKERIVTVYGMINLRTNGQKVIIAQKLERPRGIQTWDIHQFEWNDQLKTIERVETRSDS